MTIAANAARLLIEQNAKIEDLKRFLDDIAWDCKQQIPHAEIRKTILAKLAKEDAK